MSVYTKTGDRGKTSIFSGKRISKSSKLINTIGAIDELNAHLGLIGGLSKIQKNLFTINAILAGAKLKHSKDEVLKLEKEIDRMEKKLPVQTKFLIYSGSLKSRRLYFARALCRKAERNLVFLSNSKFKVNSTILVYLNRLSDYLFILARYTNFKKKIKESAWNQ